MKLIILIQLSADSNSYPISKFHGDFGKVRMF
ncbi:hypothetical protein HNQ56_004656 [Anaerotaenia torta]